MSMLLLASVASFALAELPASPHPEMQVEELQCLEKPTSAAALTAYDAYLDEFTFETIDGKLDPELIALIDAEVAQCSSVLGWSEDSAQFARLWVIGRLVQAASWRILPLEGDARDRLFAALDKGGEYGTGLVGSFVALGEKGKPYVTQWTLQLIEAAELEDDRELGEALGMYVTGTYFRKYAREKFIEMNMQEEE